MNPSFFGYNWARVAGWQEKSPRVFYFVGLVFSEAVRHPPSLWGVSLPNLSRPLVKKAGGAHLFPALLRGASVYETEQNAPDYPGV